MELGLFILNLCLTDREMGSQRPSDPRYQRSPDLCLFILKQTEGSEATDPGYPDIGPEHPRSGSASPSLCLGNPPHRDLGTHSQEYAASAILMIP